MLDSGRGVAKDEAAALEWYRRAAEKGEPITMLKLGLKHQAGSEGIQANEREAAKWFQRAAAKGSVRGMIELAKILEVRSDSSAESWHRAAAKTGDPEAMTGLASFLSMNVENSLEPEESLKWYRRAAEAGHVPAMVELGAELKRGSPEALVWFRRAALAGNLKGMWYLANSLGEDQATESVRWYRLAAEKGDTSSMADLGLMLEAGIGVQRNKEEAAAWYRRVLDHADKSDHQAARTGLDRIERSER
ncbi:MAG: sel1 repeat family protein [Planctomycetes bacterium]|nr:sel1 repeat family protein [Planctomycetota bacterium]